MIDGECQARYGAVRRALTANLADPMELGEAVAVVIDGETVIDLWGGYQDRERTRRWEHDTLACVFSVGKPVAALALGQLMAGPARDRLRLEDPVIGHWPGYGAAGKAATTVDHILSHLAGVPGVPDAPRGSAYDWDAMIAHIEAQAPRWAPGTTGCYHTFTYGHLVGELVRRVSGRSIGTVVREDIARPLDLDLRFGLDAAERARCADVVMTPGDPLLAAITSPDTLIGRCWTPLPLGPGEEDFNSASFRAAEMPAFNAHATARALARLYSSLAMARGRRGPRQPFSPELMEMLTAEQWSGVDPLGMDNRMARGFRLMNRYCPFNRNPRAFGHNGIGGALAFGDPDRGLGFAFVTNRLAPGPGASPYAMRLVEAMASDLLA